MHSTLVRLLLIFPVLFISSVPIPPGYSASAESGVPLLAYASRETCIPGFPYHSAAQEDTSALDPMDISLPERGEAFRKRKSWLTAVAGAAVSPYLGHAYVGSRENIERGLLYTGSETFLILTFIGTALSGRPGQQGDDHSGRARDYLYWLGANRLVSMADAGISAYNLNKGYRGKSYFISMAGSAIFPVIGHIHLGGKSLERAAAFSLAEAILFFPPDYRYRRNYIYARNGVRGIAVFDAYITADRMNQSARKRKYIPALFPDILARSLTLSWSF